MRSIGISVQGSLAAWSFLSIAFHHSHKFEKFLDETVLGELGLVALVSNVDAQKVTDRVFTGFFSFQFETLELEVVDDFLHFGFVRTTEQHIIDIDDNGHSMTKKNCSIL